MPLSLKAKSQSSSVDSKIVPLWTIPAQLNNMSGSLIDPTKFLIALLSVTSSIWVSSTILSKEDNVSRFISVAITYAPASENALAVAFPMP